MSFIVQTLNGSLIALRLDLKMQNGHPADAAKSGFAALQQKQLRQAATQGQETFAASHKFFSTRGSRSIEGHTTARRLRGSAEGAVNSFNQATLCLLGSPEKLDIRQPHGLTESDAPVSTARRDG